MLNKKRKDLIMMNKRKVIKSILTALFVCASFPAYANGLNFVNDLDIKNSGAGGAYSVFSAGAFSAFTNPAGLGNAPRQELSMVYYNLFEGASLSGISYCLPLLERGTISVSGAFLSSGSTEERDDSNQLISSFDDSFTAIYASYGILLYDFISAGLSLKYLHHSFYTEESGGVGADVGVIFMLPYDLRAAIVVQNVISPEFTYSSAASDTLPLSGSVSAGWSASFTKDLNDILKAAVSLSFTEYKSSPGWNAGAEYSVYDMFFLRAGINDEGLSAGASVKYQNAGVHYAIVQKPADLVHRFSIAYSFGDDIRKMESQFKNKETKARYELIEKIKGETVGAFEVEINELIKSGDYENARITIEKALIWAPQNEWFLEKQILVGDLLRSDKIKTYLADAELLMQSALYIDALVSLKNVLDLDPKNEMAASKLSRTQQLIRTLGEDNYAVEAGNKEAIQKHFEAGLDYYTTGQFERAVDEWDKVIKASPLQSQVYKYIKSAQDKIKKIEKAVSLKKISEEKKLSNLYNEAVMFYTKGEFEKSIGAWKEYLKLEPDNTEAKEYVEKITKEYLELQKQKLEW